MVVIMEICFIISKEFFIIFLVFVIVYERNKWNVAKLAQWKNDDGKKHNFKEKFGSIKINSFHKFYTIDMEGKL